MRRDVSSWLSRAVTDAEARGLPELKPLLESLARSLDILRGTDEEFGHPALPEGDESSAG